MPICDLPTGRGGGTASTVPNDTGADSTVRNDPPESRANMTKGTGEKPDNRRGGSDALLATLGLKMLGRPPKRSLGNQSAVACRAIEVVRLENPQEGCYTRTRKNRRRSRSSSNGKCRFKGFRGQCLVRTWLYIITINKCRSHQRRQRLHLKGLLILACPSLCWGLFRHPEQALQAVRRALDRLPNRYREPAVLWYLQELPTEQICQVLAINRNTLHVRLARARERLRGLLAGLEDEL